MTINQIHHPSSALEKLDQGKNYKVMLIVAPSGSGKTDLIEQWTQHLFESSDLHPITIRIESEDNHPAQFINKLITGITTWEPNFQDQQILQDVHQQIPAERTCRSDQEIDESIEGLINEFVNGLMALNGDRFLVFPNYHKIVDDSIHSMMMYLIDYLPSNLHLVITSELTPPLQIPRLRARRELLEITLEELLKSET